MAEVTSEHNESPAEQGDAGPASTAVAFPERFTLSIQIPQLRFVGANAQKLKNKLRDVAKEAMMQSEKKRCEKPVGIRVHLQFEANNPEGAPPEQVHQTGYTFVSALRGVVFNSPRNVAQLLITKSWGPIDGVSVTVWEIQ